MGTHVTFRAIHDMQRYLLFRNKLLRVYCVEICDAERR